MRHFIDYGGWAYPAGSASYFDGWADFTLPSPGSYWFMIQGAGWLPPYAPPSTGAFALALVDVGP